MADTILVTTDLSANSRAALRFAFQLASQNGSKLVFYHMFTVLKPTRWSERRYNAFVTQEAEEALKRLKEFVAAEGRRAGVNPARLECVAENGSSVDQAIIDYAQQTRARYVCLSTHGAGLLRKVLGTVATLVLTRSPIPVLIVPSKWRKTPVRRLLYASDFNNLGYELKKVNDFARPLRAPVMVYHYDYLLHVKENLDKLKKTVSAYKTAGVTFHFQRQNIENSLAFHIQHDVRRAKASMVALFTKQNRGWYERIFLSSQSAELSLATTVPLIIFRKKP